MKKSLFKKRRAKQTGFSVATLAPMVDIFTILVIAVLKSSSPESPMSVPEPNFEPALSIQERGHLKAIQIDLGTEGIYLEGYRITSRKYWEESEELLIKELYTLLEQQGKKQVQIRSDHRIPWKLTRKVLLTAQQAGYENIELLALSNSSL
jgi:biopolymer transport protein ExbD